MHWFRLEFQRSSPNLKSLKQWRTLPSWSLPTLEDNIVEAALRTFSEILLLFPVKLWEEEDDDDEKLDLDSLVCPTHTDTDTQTHTHIQSLRCGTMLPRSRLLWEHSTRVKVTEQSIHGEADGGWWDCWEQPQAANNALKSHTSGCFLLTTHTLPRQPSSTTPQHLQHLTKEIFRIN